MGMQSYISEVEAAAIAGVSVSTLKRFAEAGYLAVEVDSDGLRMFSEREISSVFGITERRYTAPSSGSSVVKPSESTTRSSTGPSSEANHNTNSNTMADGTVRQETGKQLPPNRSPLVEAIQVLKESDSTDSAFKATSLKEKTETNETLQRTSETTARTPSNEEPPSKLENGAQAAQTSEPSTLLTAQGNLGTHTTEKVESNELEKLSVLEGELAKAKKMLELQEKLMEWMDQQKAERETEINWLRARVERSEEKGDRDQILLLSETQVIRQLISNQHRKDRRSPLRATLEWFGLVTPEEERPNNPSAIEMRRSAPAKEATTNSKASNQN